MTKTKWLLVVAIVAIIAAWFFLGGAEFLNFATIKEKQVEWAALYAESPLKILALFFAVYVLVTSLSLPGAALLTLLAGALFGLWVGLVLVSFASSIGATLAFLVARYLARDAVQRKFSDALTTVNQGVEKEGAFYLFSLRLVPVFPFVLVNIVMALTPIKTWPFYWVSQLGMLAGTFVYVNAGTQLAGLESSADILSLPLLLSFCLLGVLPLVAKRVVTYLRGRR